MAEVSQGDQALTAAVKAQFDVASLDIEMPGSRGLSAAEALHKSLPSCRIVILTTFGRSGYLRRAMESGAVAIRRVMAGERMVDSELALSALSDGHNPFTPRERDVLRASLDGASIAGISTQLYPGEGMVRNRISIAIQKLNVQNRTEASHSPRGKGWL